MKDSMVKMIEAIVKFRAGETRYCDLFDVWQACFSEHHHCDTWKVDIAEFLQLSMKQSEEKGMR
jgi:hypothetical protein